MNLLVTGASGYLGFHLLREARRLGLAVRAQVRPGSAPPPGAIVSELHGEDVLARLLESASASAVVHAAAMADARACFRDPEAARRINAEIPGQLARVCARAGARLIHVSTDLVFDGEHPPYRESDPAEPVSVYGRTKLAGEQEVLAGCADALVCRLPLLYGPSPDGARGASDMVLRALREGQSLRLFSDERRSPLHAGTAARLLLTLAGHAGRGILHLASRSSLSRYELGLAFAARLGLPAERIQPVEAATLDLEEARARDVTLVVERALEEFGLSLPAGLSARALIPD